MKQTISILFLAVSLLTQAFAQSQSGQVQGATRTEAQANAQRSDSSLNLASGMQVSAELLSTLDARNARPGDEFKLRTLKPVMAGGKQVVGKGATLTGRVVEATRAAGKQEVSQLKLAFDQLKNKNLTVPFSATIEQITSASAGAQADDQSLSAGADISSGSRANSTAGSGGGLLGGVTGATRGAVGGVTSTAGSAVGSAVEATHQAAGRVLARSGEVVTGTAGKAAQLPQVIAISSGADAQVDANSTLSLTGRNVRIEKGAVFLLRTTQSSDATGK